MGGSVVRTMPQPTAPTLGTPLAEPGAAPRWPRLPAFAAAGVLALLVASQTYLSMIDHGHSYWRIFGWQLGCWSFWAAIAPPIQRRGAALAANGVSVRSVGLLSVAFALLASLQILTAALLEVLIQPYLPVATYSLGVSLRRQVFPWLPINLVTFALLLVSGAALAARQRQQTLELRESRLETQLARAQLYALRLKVRPHFLFNTLNSIAALVRESANERALSMILGLSGLLRDTLERAEQQEVSLEDELEFAEKYLELERNRFADRLTVEFDIEPSCLELPVPNLLLQPLIENAVRHGVGRSEKPVRVEIGARREAGRLRLWVADDGPGLPGGFDLGTDSGVGLGSTVERLVQLHGEGAELELGPGSRDGVVASILLPLPAAESSPSGPVS